MKNSSPSCLRLPLVSRYTGHSFIVKGFHRRSLFIFPSGSLLHGAWESVEVVQQNREKDATTDVSATQSIRADGHNGDDDATP